MKSKTNQLQHAWQLTYLWIMRFLTCVPPSFPTPSTSAFSEFTSICPKCLSRLHSDHILTGLVEFAFLGYLGDDFSMVNHQQDVCSCRGVAHTPPIMSVRSRHLQVLRFPGRAQMIRDLIESTAGMRRCDIPHGCSWNILSLRWLMRLQLQNLLYVCVTCLIKKNNKL